MSFAEYLINSLVGILVVFFALVLLMIIIKVITAVTDKQEAKKNTAPAAEKTVAEAAPKAVVYAKGTAGDLNLYDTDPRDAAMIMAIVADETKTPLNELRFISIREVKE